MAVTTWQTSTGVLACPYCGTDVPVAVEYHGSHPRLSGVFSCQLCGRTFRVRARDVLDRISAAEGVMADGD